MHFRTLLRLANLLTLLRLFLVPPLILCFQANLMRLALIIFAVAALTDHFDGKIARKQGVTGFGKFMDPLADKLLVVAVLICFTLFERVEGGLIPAWMVLIIIGREFIVTGLRVAFIAKCGQIVAANRWGKYKTSSQLAVIIISLILLAFQRELKLNTEFIIQQHGPIYFMMFLPLVLTVASGTEFLINNRKVLYGSIQTGERGRSGADV